MIEEKLLELRRKWEGDLTVIAEKEGTDTHLMLLKDLNDNSYRMHRYFKVGNDWLISINFEGATAEYAMTYLFKFLAEI